MTTGRPASLLSRLLGLAAVGGNLPKSDGHGLEVRQCVTPNGKLRFFVEHWHDDLSSASQASTMEIVEQVTGSSPVQETKYADGMFNNKNIYNGVRGWGCRNDDIPTVVRSCHNHNNLISSNKNDWVYYERSATCGVQITYTLLQGNTFYLEDGCTFRSVPGYALYPAAVGPATFQDTSAPIPRVDGHGLPHEITVIVAAPGDTAAIVDFEVSASDDCDADPAVSSSLPSGHAFPLGSTTVQVNATDDQGNAGVGNLVVNVKAWVDECNDGTHNCHADATCDDLQDGYDCACKPGFMGNGFTCDDIDECARNEHDCDENASCSDTEGGFLCECNEGWLGNGKSCHTLSPTTSPTTKPSLSRIPSRQPSRSPSLSDWPTSQPSKFPSSSRRPSMLSSRRPSISSFPSTQPSESPSASDWPTSQPSDSPSVSFHPSLSSIPSAHPSEGPSTSDRPTLQPSESPSLSGRPSLMPSDPPSTSSFPTTQPSMDPSASHWPTSQPSLNSSVEPSTNPSLSGLPSSQPSETPSASHWPTSLPSESPSFSGRPSSQPSESPSASDWPTSQPSDSPSVSVHPSLSSIPSAHPSERPSTSDRPTLQPSESPSLSGRPSLMPSDPPSTSLFPTTQPSMDPSASHWPTSQPSLNSSVEPSTNPSLSGLPSSQPSETPSASHWPTSLPSESPSFSGRPSSMPSKIDECADDSLNDCDTNAICTDTPGSFTCTCNQGWQGNGTTCININECANDDNICHEESNCRDTDGSFRCDGLVDDAYVPNSCNKGWTGNGLDCTNIDECATNEGNNCDTNAICTDTQGSFTCTCNQGWRGNGTTCANINECEEGEDDCDKNAICTDTNGSWTCACPDGWIGDGQECEALSPTRSPIKSPSTSPTASPSLLPSLQPSIVIQSVTTTGSLSTTVDFCGMEGEQLDGYKGAALASILEVYKCNAECTAEITNLCNTPQSSSRMLQTSTWQLDFAITESFTCEKATCDSLSDTAKTASIVAGIATPIEGSLATDEFLSILSQKILDTGIFSADIVLCFAVWGMVNSDPVLEVATPAEEGLFYPDWLAHSGTCLQGEAPRYMESNPEGWLFESLEGCCKRYYDGWNFNQCMNIKGSGLWYVSQLNEKCVTDCEEGQGRTCGGLANPISDDLYGDPRSCCVADLPWRFVEFCEAESLLSNCYDGTGLYYRGDTAGSKVCVRDCDPDASGDTTCGGLVEDTYVELYDSAKECCSEEYGWMENELCAARSDQVSVSKYWPDMTNSKCILDSHLPAEDLSISIYNSTAECCKKGIHWLSEAECLAASGDIDYLVASDMFFVDWVNERCVQDCEGAPPCTGLGKVQNYDEMYGAASECCDQIPWIPREKCISGS